VHLVRDSLPADVRRAPVLNRLLVIGVGNADRGDDGVGLEVVRCLADLHRPPEVEVRPYQGEAIGLLELWEGADAVVLVDCMRAGASPGTIRRFAAAATPVPLPLRATSSHAIGVGEAIELARALGTLPREIVAYGIEGSAFEAGAELGAEVAAAIGPAADAVRREAAGMLAGSRPPARTG
jgi:hydrogenase maturation protease